MGKPDFNIQYTLSLAVMQHPELIIAIKRSYATDDIWQYCIDQKPELFQYCKDPSRRLCELAVAADGHNIIYVPECLMDGKLIDEAIIRCPSVIFEIPDEYVSRKRVHMAFDRDPSLLQQLHNYDDVDYLRELIERNPSDIQYINNPPEWLKLLAIRKDPSAALMIPKEQWTSYMKKDMKSRYPDFYRSMSF